MVHRHGLATPKASRVPVRHWKMEHKKLLGYMKRTDIVSLEKICDAIPVPGEKGIARVKGKRLPPLKKIVRKWTRLWTLNTISELKFHGVLLKNA
jgi:hypothetical protein